MNEISERLELWSTAQLFCNIWLNYIPFDYYWKQTKSGCEVSEARLIVTNRRKFEEVCGAKVETENISTF